MPTPDVLHDDLVHEIAGSTVNIHITRRCNFRCDYCFAVYAGIPELTSTQWFPILEQLRGERVQHSLNRGNGNCVERTRRIFELVRSIGADVGHVPYLKINSVVARPNKDDDPTNVFLQLSPNRVKLFQFCAMAGENDAHAARLSITDDEFWRYVSRVRGPLERAGIIVVPETQEVLRRSYLILDPQGRFCDKTHGRNTFSPSLTSVSVRVALSALYSRHDLQDLLDNMGARGGLYDLAPRDG